MSEAMPSQTDELFSNPFADLTAFRRDLLVAIHSVEESGTPRDGFDYPEPTGQCVKETIEQQGYDTINHGRLYPNLDSLVNKGLVEKVSVDRRTNGYKLTDEGQQALENYCTFVGGE